MISVYVQYVHTLQVCLPSREDTSSVAEPKLFVSALAPTFKKFRLRLQLETLLLTEKVEAVFFLIFGKNSTV